MGDEALGEKFSRKTYEKELKALQERLCHLQDWIRSTWERVIRPPVNSSWWERLSRA